MKIRTFVILNIIWLVICLILNDIADAYRGYPAIGGEDLIIGIPYLIAVFSDTTKQLRGRK